MVSNSSQVFGASTPAFLSASVLIYMIGAEELNGMLCMYSPMFVKPLASISATVKVSTGAGVS